MFWGLTIEAGKKYAQTVKNSFHISMAALELRTPSDDEVSVVLEVDGNAFVLCNLLRKQHVVQQPLDLNFIKGDRIALCLKGGKGSVHLSGFLVPNDYLDEEDFDEMEEESEDEEVPQLTPIAENKRKADPPSAEKKAKKLKAAEPVQNGNDDGSDSDDDDDEDEDDDDEDEDENDSSDEDAEDSDIDIEAVDDSDDDEEDGEEEEDSDEEDEEVEEEEEEAVKPVSPKKQQQQQQQKNKTPQKQLQQQQQQKIKTPQSQQKSEKTPKKQEKTPNKAANGAATPKEQQSNKKGEKQTPKQTPKAEEKKAATPGTKKTLQGGVVIEDLVVGNGPTAAPGKFAGVYYVGKNKHNNKVFDQTMSGPAFKFRLGKGDVIKGWDIGLQGMKVGGKRRVICPPHMAYGSRGSPPVIAPNATLVFDVELKSVS